MKTEDKGKLATDKQGEAASAWPYEFEFKQQKDVRHGPRTYAQRLSFDSNDEYFSYYGESTKESQAGDPKSTNGCIKLEGFAVKYKTEMCRNWELYGYCEFNDSVRII